MNTIKDLTEQWWGNFPIKRNIELLSKYHPDDGLDYKKIENIFYQEVILKWYVGKYGKIEFDYNEEEIKNIYLKEHSKEEPKGINLSTIQPNGKTVKENIDNYFDKLDSYNELLELIKSDSVYALLRQSVKRPSSTGIDDCDDDSYLDLYNISTILRNQ